MLMLTISLVLYPATLSSMPSLSFMFIQVILALAAFILPLRFVNERLVAEKLRLQGELNQRLETSLGRLNGLIDGNKISEAAVFNDALAALTTERDILNRIPTWPWRPGTLTGFLSAIGLPIILFLLQFFIENWLTR
jgi:hypothetical protein